MNEEKKKEILELLKEGEMVTGKISSKIGRNQYKTEEMLEELKEERKIESEKKGKGTYWRLKKK